MTTATRTLVAPGAARVRTRRPIGRRFTVLTVLAFAVLLILAIGWLLPFLWAVATAFKTETDAASGDPGWIGASGPTVQAFSAILSQGNVYLWAWNSLWTATAVTVLTVTISALAAYAFSRLDFRGRRGLFTVIIAAIVAALLIGKIAQRQFGGYTGDVLGAAEQVAEVAVLVNLVSLT